MFEFKDLYALIVVILLSIFLFHSTPPEAKFKIIMHNYDIDAPSVGGWNHKSEPDPNWKSSIEPIKEK